MIWIVLNIFLILVAIFGAITLGTATAGLLRRKPARGSPNVKLLLMVKDGEDIVEGVVRSTFMGDYLKKMRVDEKLVVLDMGSQDNTRNILYRLKEEYASLEVLENGEKEKIFTYFN